MSLGAASLKRKIVKFIGSTVLILQQKIVPFDNFTPLGGYFLRVKKIICL